TFHGNFPSLLSAQSRMANPVCLRLFAQVIRCALLFARLRAGNNIPARIAMIAMTTSNSMSVKAFGVERAALMRPSCIAKPDLGTKQSRYAEELPSVAQRIRAGD